MRTRVTVGVLATAALAIAGSYAYLHTRESAAPAYRTAPLTLGDVVETVDATGTVQAVTTVQVGTQVSGTIKTLYADFNSRVRRGQVVAELEPSLFEAQAEQARASVARAEADAARAAVQADEASRKRARARDLAARQLLAAADLEAAEMAADEAEAAVTSANAQRTQAQAAQRQAEVNLAHTVITAPIDGLVISRNVDVGQTVAASMQAPTLFVIAKDLARMQVEASIAEADIGRIAAGQPASFHVDAYPGELFTGVVSQVRLAPVVQQNVVSYVTVIDAPNRDLRLKPGMTATVTVEVARARGVLRAPNAALRVRPPSTLLTQEAGGASDSAATVVDEDGQQRRLVWVVAEGGLRPVPVRVGISDGNYTAVEGESLANGTEVVTSIATGSSGSATQATSPLLPFGGRIPGGGRGGQRPQR